MDRIKVRVDTFSGGRLLDMTVTCLETGLSVKATNLIDSSRVKLKEALILELEDKIKEHNERKYKS